MSFKIKLQDARGKSETIKLLAIIYSIPLFIRLLPEILAWPYPLGFDTVTYYIPKMVEGTYLKMSIPNLMKTTSLYYILETILYKIYPDPVMIIKVLGPILYATMITLIGLYAYKRTGFDEKWTILTVAIASLCLIGLRLAWDLYRNMLGFIFIFATLITITSDNRKIKYLSIPLGFLTVWSHELAAVYLILILTVILLTKIIKSRDLDIPTLITLLISGTLFLYQRINPVQYTLNIPLSSIGVTKGINELLLGIEFIVYTSLILLILMMPGIKEMFRDNILNIWTAFTSILFILPLAGISTIFLYRIVLILILPLPIYTTLGLKYSTSKIGRKGLIYPITGVIIIGLISMPYLVTTPYNPTLYTKFFYYDIDKNIFYTIPTGYLQNSVSINSMYSLVYLIDYSLKNLPPNSTLILPRQFYWIALTALFKTNVTVRNIEEVNPWRKFSLQDPNNKVTYFIWWANKLGWYGIQNLPKNFVEIVKVKEFALYHIEQKD